MRVFLIGLALAASALPPATHGVLSWTAGPAVSAAGSAQGRGSIRGRLDITDGQRVPRHRPEVTEVGAAAPHIERPPVGVVYLETAPAGAFEEMEPTRGAVMDQRHETFVPHVLAVRVGTVVEFPNSDSTYHNVFSLSRPRRFDLGRYAAGRSKSVRFDRPGVVRVFCDIHSHMSAFVLVFSHPFFDVTDADGRFRLDNVPPGAYTIVGWYEGDVRVTRPVSVPPGGVAGVELAVP
jgi:plastocyanin